MLENTEKLVKIAWWGKHFGEEPPLVGGVTQGAGTIFFSGCNLRCVFCQNYQISQEGIGKDYSIDELVAIMLELQAQGAVNIDLVTPTIWWRAIKEAVIQAREQGLKLPIVWNSNAYESIEMLEDLRGIIDVYLPDMKYGFDELGKKYSDVTEYSRIAIAAIKEMYDQVGLLKTDEKGIAISGVIVRHLVLPNNLENSLEALKMVMNIDPLLTISLMNQYSPMYKAKDFPEINCEANDEMFETIVDYLLDLGWENGWRQEKGSSQVYKPDFTKDIPFLN